MSGTPRHPKLEEAKRWAEAQQPLLQAVWEHFEQHASWPDIEMLQRQFERRGLDIDVARLGFEMPSGLGFVEEQRLVLRVRGLGYVPSAADVLDAWAAALRIAYRHYVENDEATLTSSDLRVDLGLDAGTARLVSSLLLRERWAFGSGRGSADEEWAQEVRSGVRVVRGTRNASELLAARDALDYPTATGGAAARTGDTKQIQGTSGVRAHQADSRDVDRPRRVMVVYGRDGAANRALFAWLRAIDLQPQEWTQLVHATGVGSPYTGEVLDHALEIVQAVVVLFTPDEMVRLRDDLLDDHDGLHEREVHAQPRPNVLFEAGLAYGRHPERTIVVEYGRLRGFSDLFGRHNVRLEGGVSALHDLAERLRATGCAVNTSGSDWLNTTSFPPSAGHSAGQLDIPEPTSELRLPATNSADPLVRLVREIVETAAGGPVAEDVPIHVARSLRALSGPTRGDELFAGLPGRRMPIEVMKRTLYELEEHGVLRRNPDQRVRGYVLGELP